MIRIAPPTRPTRATSAARLQTRRPWSALAERLPTWVLWGLPALGLLLVLRIPAFAEPHWYTDEAGYVTTSQMWFHGATLYRTAWTNKPPLQLLLVGLTVLLGGARIWPLHLVTLLASGAAVSAVAWFGARHLGLGRTLGATLLVAFLLGLPILDAELAVPESFLIAPATWALLLTMDLALAADSRLHLRRLLLIGGLGAAAAAFQQTALADCILCIGITAVAARRPLRAAVIAAAAAALTGAWLLWAVITAGAGAVWFSLVGFYGSYVTQSLSPGQTPGGHLVATLALAALLGLGVLTAIRRRRWGWMAAAWLALELLIAVAANQTYAHFLVPAVVPAALLLAAASPRRWLESLRRPRRLLGGVRYLPLAAGLAVLAVNIWSLTLLDWIPPNWYSPSTNHGLADYYVGFWQSVGSRTARQSWASSFDPRVSADKAVSAWITHHRLTQDTAVVWSSDAWVYDLAHLQVLLPTPPIYNDEALLGSNGQVAQRVASIDPQLVITSSWDVSAYPDITPVLQSGYCDAFNSGPDAVWLRLDVAQSIGLTAVAQPSLHEMVCAAQPPS